MGGGGGGGEVTQFQYELLLSFVFLMQHSFVCHYPGFLLGPAENAHAIPNTSKCMFD